MHIYSFINYFYKNDNNNNNNNLGLFSIHKLTTNTCMQ